MISYWDKEKVCLAVMAEMEWPERDRPLLVWYIEKLGINNFIAVWQDQTFANEHRPPRSKYRAFRARLSKAITPTP